MTLHHNDQHGWLLRNSLRFLKGYGYFLLGLTAACLLATILGCFPMAQSVLAVIGTWIIRILGILVTLTATGAVFESLRN